MEDKKLTTRDVSKKQEEAVAKALGGHRTANSGATTFSKGDVVGTNYVIECKARMEPSNSMTVQKAWLDTLEEDRIGSGKSLSALAISFGDGRNHYVISEKHMRMLIELIDSDFY